MFIHSSAFCNGFTPECIQPNALDITCDDVTEFYIPEGQVIDGIEFPFVLRKDGTKSNRYSRSLEPIDGILYDLLPGQYSFESDTTCEIPAGVVGWLVSRSTLNRNGIFIQSGVYDSGFKGRVGGTIYVQYRTQLEKGTRVAQLITARADSLHLYDGQYQAR